MAAVNAARPGVQFLHVADIWAARNGNGTEKPIERIDDLFAAGDCATIEGADIPTNAAPATIVINVWRLGVYGGTIGAAVADDVRELARLRNEAARSLGYRDWFALAIEISEMDETRLFETLDECDRLTAEPFARSRRATSKPEPSGRPTSVSRRSYRDGPSASRRRRASAHRSSACTAG